MDPVVILGAMFCFQESLVDFFTESLPTHEGIASVDRHCERALLRG
jgi:hypothetical protein